MADGAAPSNVTDDTKTTWEPKMAQILKANVTSLAAKTGNGIQRPYMVALAGIPGSGKTTSGNILAKEMGSSCIVIPMDGYHYSVKELRAMPDPKDVVYRRGAPDTFNARALQRDLEKIANGTDATVSVPGFDHAVGDPHPGLHTFDRKQHNVVIIEGLYLLYEGGDWEGTSKLFDHKIFIQADIDACIEGCKIRNRCIPGYTVEEIDKRCDIVDRKNAELVAATQSKADTVVASAST